jgi:ATP-dependent DNA helicase RecG
MEKKALLSSLEGVGKIKLQSLKKLEIDSIPALITFFPRDYKDRREFNRISDCLKTDEELIIKASLKGFDYIITKNGKRILKVIISDGSIKAELVCFNRDFLRDTLTIEREYIVCGKFNYKFNAFQSSDFDILIPERDIYNYNRIVPVYPLTAGLNQSFMRRIIYDALSKFVSKGKETLPEYIIEKRNLMDRSLSIKSIHFPADFESLKKAKERLSYFEFFKVQLSLGLKRLMLGKTKKERKISKGQTANKLIASLPFGLTTGQLNVIGEIKNDLYDKKPMSRLLMGDVGSGKTIVSLIASCDVMECGYQAALMAPTEVLSRQHFINAEKLLSPLGFKCVFLYSKMGTAERKEALDDIRSGRADFIAGTHILFQKSIEFKSLGLVIIDEQHRFGVNQRMELLKKAENCDVLYTSATPIPRTVSMCIYGDLDISTLKEKPFGNKNLKTEVIADSNINVAFDKIRDEVSKGNKAFIIYPIIEESETLDLKAASTMYKKIKDKYLKGIDVGIIHGRMDSANKEEAISDFTCGKISVLVSTTVVEVGVDIKEATVILIENAHRYGLSALHQLRGRVGRAGNKSFCYLSIPDNASADIKHKMEILKKSNDGFYVAEEDFKLRGPGELLGYKQHGNPDFKIASLTDDRELLIKVHEDVEEILSNDPSLSLPEHQILKSGLYRTLKKDYNILLRS